MTQSNAQKAVECFNSGFNCAQSVLSAYSEQYGLDRETALKISCGFGGGMGRLQDTCGAVSGAYMLIGLKHGQALESDGAAKEKTYALVREFKRRFDERNGSTNCRALLGADLTDGDPEKLHKRVRVVCPKMVRDAAEIVEALLAE